MRKVYLPSILCFLCILLLIPVIRAGSTNTYRYSPKHHADFSSAEYMSNLLYDSLRLSRLGLSRQALVYAYKGQQNMAKKGMLDNTQVLTVCDFTQPSSSKRLYIIDVKNFKLLLHTYVAHGKNSGLNYAERFSNRMKSLASSLGFYVTRNTYFGKHGLSLRLSGKDRGFNDNAERREVVVHGAEYIGDDHSGYMGRSFGCPAVPQHLASKIIDLIKNGTCLFIYHPSKSYLHGSRILNG